MTEWHIRYGGRGVIIYWHVEKKSTCIYSQLKRCSSSEVAAMFEGGLRHCTDMDIDKQCLFQDFVIKSDSCFQDTITPVHQFSHQCTNGHYFLSYLTGTSRRKYYTFTYGRFFRTTRTCKATLSTEVDRTKAGSEPMYLSVSRSQPLKGFLIEGKNIGNFDVDDRVPKFLFVEPFGNRYFLFRVNSHQGRGGLPFRNSVTDMFWSSFFAFRPLDTSAQDQSHIDLGELIIISPRMNT